MRTYPDPFFRRWSRRTLTYTMVAVGFLTMIVTAPVWLPVALIVDAFRRVHLSTTRAVCFILLYLYWQVWGLVGMFFIWLFHSRNPDVYMKKMFAIEFNWGWNLGNAGIRLFGIKVNLEDEYEFGKRPAIVLCRHASITDTFIPLMYICKRFNLPLKYVMKRELEWDPCLDLAVNRMPHLFVVRGSNDATKEIEAIASMMDNAQPNEGVIIFPEGTRYTPAKRARIIQKLRESGADDVVAWAERYQHVLPPRTGGPLALLDHAGKADIVFCAHTGLEHSSTFKDTFNGSLVGAQVHIKFWGAHEEDIPADEEARKQWLFEQWKKVDEYIEERSRT
jgi:1-acyl-sn-glycerol-3-phosphate acyltransferase